MTDEEHERLVRLEVLQSEIQKDVAEIKTTVAKFERFQSRAGGIIIGFSLVAAAISWALTNLKVWLSMGSP